MVLHMLLMAKLPLLYLFKFSPLLWPFNLYLPLARQLPRVCITISSAASFLAFHLRQIVATEREGRQRFDSGVHLVSEQHRLHSSGTTRHSSLHARGRYYIPALFALSL